MAAYPVFDNHVHLQRSGRFLDAVKEFKTKGGTGFMLIALPPGADILSREYFQAMYEEGVRLREQALSVGGIDILLAVGPYPVTLLEMAERIGLEEAEERMVAAAELAGRFVSEGKADAIGEIGRPHFDVPQEVMAASNRIMLKCMEQSRDAGCPVILHTEDPTPASLTNLASMADRAGIERNRVIKHHCSDLITPVENSGLFPSVKATRDIVYSSVKKGTRFMMETDYIDDSKRPGAFMGIGTVPRRTRELLENSLLSEEEIWKINYENPVSLYGRDKFRKTA
jgi:TatD-related deoxyribonuclease